MSATCSGLSLTLTDYEGDSDNNHVTVTVDGVAKQYSFGSSFDTTVSWDSSVAHSWNVVIDANLLSGDPTYWDATRSGTHEACTTATTTPPSSEETTTTVSTPPSSEETTTTAPTTTSPATTPSADSTTTTVTSDTSTPPLVENTNQTTTTTAVLVAQEPPVPPSGVGSNGATPRSPAGSQLPATGGNSSATVGLGAAALLGGLALVRLARRPSRGGNAGSRA